jgi:hypothetical protein
MKRAGSVVAALAIALFFTFMIVTLGSVTGCSGSSGTIEQAERNDEADKVVQDKMREYMSKKPANSARKR